jgi:ribosomal protein S18 acetylase RimI-like enzyme
MRYLDGVTELVWAAEFPLVKRQLGRKGLRKMIAADEGIYSHRHFKLALGPTGELLGVLNSRSAQHDDVPAEREIIRRLFGFWGCAGLIVRSLIWRINMNVDWPPRDAFHVEHIAVSPQSRGLGIGSQLLDHAEAEARAANLPVIDLDVLSANTAAQRLYARHGFQIVPTPPPRRSFWRTDSYSEMEKTLTTAVG